MKTVERFFVKAGKKQTLCGPEDVIDGQAKNLLADGWNEVPQYDLLADAKENAKFLIDIASGKARARRVSVGDLMDQEYIRAYEEAKAFKAAGYLGLVPVSVQAWADAKGWTAPLAADDILNKRDQWMTALDDIRAIRIRKKAAVETALSLSDVATARDAAIAALDLV